MVFNFLLSFLYKFGQRRQFSCFKSVPVLGNVVVVHFLEFRRGVVADGIAGSDVVVVQDVLIDDVGDIISVPALPNMEIGIELFLNPSVERLVDGVVGRLPRTRHGAYDKGFLYEFVIRHRGVYRSLVCMQHGGFRTAFEHVHDVLESSDVLLSLIHI